ncbi:hypothetical protein [Streptacidiphilus anmyonensis]|uniref:hypothetical protein n=1 Tax=Streptacidiphilus anmyonensis TaxID=405782 RepID=UPI0005A62DB8|nr:hypothetical protein [Streptacidiphilus anmyonensis]
MGFKFSLVLNRTITAKETAALRDAGCGEAAFGTDTLPTDASVKVTRLDFDDTLSATLAEAIEAGLEAVKKVPDLSVPGLNVPAQAADRAAAGQEQDADPAALLADGADLVEAALVD